MVLMLVVLRRITISHLLFFFSLNLWVNLEGIAVAVVEISGL